MAEASKAPRVDGDPDVIVIGAGPNGLTAAIYLARAGMSVVVLESAPEPGGAVRTREVTVPGFKHDLGAAFFPFGQLSPALKPLDLQGAGLVWRHAKIDSAHPAPDGTCAAIARDVEVAAKAFGKDGDAWRKIATWHAATKEKMLDAILSTLPAAREFLAFGPMNLLRFGRVAASSGRFFAETTFETEAARRVIPGLALHTDVGPDDPFGAIVGFVLAIMASSGGFGVPEGGAGSITRALVRRAEEAGVEIRCGARVERIVTDGVRAVAVRTKDGELRATRAIVADTAAPTLYLKLLDPNVVPGSIAEGMRAFPFGFGTFKMDWALDALPPWTSELARQACVVHAGDSLDDLDRFTRQVRAGQLPENPYLVIGQQSLVDATRAPPGKHTLWAYSRVPSRLEGGWRANEEAFADAIERRIEGLAPGFRRSILARRAWSPDALFAMDENLVGGDLGGGSAQLQHQLIWKPNFPYFRYRTPIERLYLGSSYTHPGAGVHGACGRNAALAVLADA